jgi:hypothetical protein
MSCPCCHVGEGIPDTHPMSSRNSTCICLYGTHLQDNNDQESFPTSLPPFPEPIHYLSCCPSLCNPALLLYGLGHHGRLSLPLGDPSTSQLDQLTQSCLLTKLSDPPLKPGWVGRVDVA